MKVSDQLIIQLLTEFEGKHMDPKTKMLSKAEGNFFVFRLNKSYVAFIPNQLFCYKDLIQFPVANSHLCLTSLYLFLFLQDWTNISCKVVVHGFNVG